MFDEGGDIWHFRDLLFEMNDMIINHNVALLEAEKVKFKNPEAAWICDRHYRGLSYHELREHFDTDARAIVYHVLLAVHLSEAFACKPSLIRKAAEMGHPLAQAAMGYSGEPDAIDWARKSAAQGEREGYHILARLCDDDLKLHHEAARRGHVLSAHECGTRMSSEDHRKWALLGIWWPYNVSTDAFDNAASVVQTRFQSTQDDSLRKSMFMIGYVAERARIKRNIRRHAHSDAMAFFVRCSRRTRDAVNCWLAVARRLGVVKDVRRMIGIMIWETRVEGLY